MRPLAPFAVVAAILVVLLAVAGVVCAPAASRVGSTPGVSSTQKTGIGFSSQEALAEHFEKHGHEFNARSESDYLKMAQALRDAPLGKEILEGVRADSVVTRFDKSSGAFLACNEDGTIRTFFRPNDGEDYYWRQLKR